MKSDEQIRSQIINAMRSCGAQPKALLNVLTGYIAQLQEEMKRETTDTMADRVCEGYHPGKAASGVYCRLCHDAELAGKYGSIPGQVPNPTTLEDEDLMDVAIMPLREDK